MAMEATQKFPSILEMDLLGSDQLFDLLELAGKDPDIVPLFIKDSKGELHIISSVDESAQSWVDEDSKLVYLGKPIDMESLKKAP